MARDFEHILYEGDWAESDFVVMVTNVQYLSNEGESAVEVLLWRWWQTFIGTSRRGYSIVKVILWQHLKT